MRPDIATELSCLQAEDRYRHRRVIDSATGIHTHMDNKAYLSFCSNDYLGLANHPNIVQAMQHGAERWGVGSGASHLISGHSHAHHALEEELADFVGTERALLFSSGYMANLGIISALCKRGDSVFEDRLNHASLLDGALLSQAKLKRYPHNDSQALANKLAQQNEGNKLVITDSVFSMDGDIAPLPILAQTAKQHDAWLMVDDAHGLGVLGKQGRGSLNHFGLNSDDCPVLMATLGKAFGTSGAFVAGSETLIEYLIQKARTYIYTTALPAAVAEATRASLRQVQKDEWRREKLRSLITQFRDGATQLGLKLMDSNTPIQPLMVGSSSQALAMSDALKQHGILISAIRPPTVPKDTARLRITFSAQHEPAHIQRLLNALEAIA